MSITLEAPTTVAQLKEPWKEILTAAEVLRKQAAQLKTLAKKLASQEGYDSLKKLDKTLEKLEGLELPDPELQQQTQEATQKVRKWLEGEWNRRATEFAAELERYVQERGFSAQLEGLTLSLHPFVLKIEAAKDTVVISYLGNEMAKSPLSCEAVFKQWQGAREILEKDDTPPETMLNLLGGAYKEALRLSDKANSTRVRVTDLHFRLFILRQTPAVRQDPRKAKVKEYPRFQFAYDLGVLLEQRGEHLVVETEDQRFTFFPATKTAAQSRSSSIQVEVGQEAVTIGDLEITEL